MIAKPATSNYRPSSFLSRVVIKTKCQTKSDRVKFLDKKSSTTIQWDCYWWKRPPPLLRSPGSDHIFLVGMRRATFYKGDRLLSNSNISKEYLVAKKEGISLCGHKSYFYTEHAIGFRDG